MKLVAKHDRYAVAAAKEFAKNKPWQGDFEERVLKLRDFHADMTEAYDIDIDLVIDTDGELGGQAGGFVTYDNPECTTTIVLKPGFAVLTYLTLFAEALSYSRMAAWTDPYGGVAGYANAWANSLFKKAFPNSFERLVARDASILTRNYVA